MMDDTTVQTTPEPRDPHEALSDAEHRYEIAFHAAWAGWSVAILLAVHVIESVIA